MFGRKTLGMLVLAASGLLLACPQKKADLVPLPDSRPGYGFCKTVSGKLVVTVRNNGSVNAPASTTTVEFSPGGVVTIPTPPIPANSPVDLPGVVIPPGCFNADCSFTIHVNADGAVDESNTTNNTGSGTCIG
jgi:CARDB